MISLVTFKKNKIFKNKTILQNPLSTYNKLDELHKMTIIDPSIHGNFQAIIFLERYINNIVEVEIIENYIVPSHTQELEDIYDSIDQ